MFFLIGKILFRFILLSNSLDMINPLVSTLIKGMLYLILKAKQGGKYLSRKQVIDKRTGRKTWKYKYKPMQQRAAHEVTRSKFEKVTKLSGDEHKNQIEHALQNGVHVSLHVLRDYPDLIVKYHQQARIAKADKIRAKVKASKEKDLASLKKMASEYVDMKESSQVSKPTADDKGREEKKMNEQELISEYEKVRVERNPFEQMRSLEKLDKILKENYTPESLPNKLTDKWGAFKMAVKDIEEHIKARGLTEEDFIIPELPKLNGSDKQIELAKKIRVAKLDNYAASLRAITMNPVTAKLRNIAPEQFIQQNKELSQKLKQIIQNDSAKFWIDNKDTRLSDFIK